MSVQPLAGNDGAVELLIVGKVEHLVGFASTEHMPGLRIRDLTRQGFLAFDPADLLELLGDAARISTWRCSVEECISMKTARPYLQEAYNTPEAVTGTELLALARETRQVIDGAFEAFHSGENTP